MEHDQYYSALTTKMQMKFSARQEKKKSHTANKKVMLGFIQLINYESVQ